MKALKILLIAFVVIIALFFIAALFAPKEQSVSKATIIKAPAIAIFYNIKFIDKMALWHPFLKKDNNLTFSVDGKDGDLGATRFWKSPVEIAGSGTDEIIEIIEPTLFKSKVNITSPNESTGTSTFSLQEIDNGTKVVWTFTYSIPYPFNALLLFGDNNLEMGKYFAEGLTGLKNTLERMEKTEVKYSLSKYDFEGGSYIFKQIIGTWEQIDAALPAAYADIVKLREMANLMISGSPIGIITSEGENNNIDYSIAIPVATTGDVPKEFVLNLEPRTDCKAVFINNLYDSKANAHRSIQKQFKDQGVEFDYPLIEEYVRGELTGDDKVATRLVYLTR